MRKADLTDEQVRDINALVEKSSRAQSVKQMREQLAKVRKEVDRAETMLDALFGGE